MRNYLSCKQNLKLAQLDLSGAIPPNFEPLQITINKDTRTQSLHLY